MWITVRRKSTGEESLLISELLDGPDVHIEADNEAWFTIVALLHAMRVEGVAREPTLLELSELRPKPTQ